MLAKLFSGTVIGLSGMLIEVEVDVANRGFPTFAIVGLPNKAIDEAKDRVRTALVNASFEMPDSRITVNLAPADIPKMGSGFDLPIALGILAASKKIVPALLEKSVFIGELSLKGELRPIPGVISIVLMVKETGIKQIFVPKANAREAATVEGVDIYPVEHLSQLIQHLKNEKRIEKYSPLFEVQKESEYEFDFKDVKGQEQVKRAMMIAAAGFHNVHLRGSPGTGKSMVCRALPSILPPLSSSESLEVAKIYSAVNVFRDVTSSERPFRSPHHTTSRIGLIGGGTVPIPGEISLAHRGVLFLDEFSEFPRSTLESLRQPLEDGSITISRASGSLTFPCRFLLLAASNPCPCGYYGHPRKRCTCSMGAVLLYKKKVSGPLLDRIDLHLNVLPVPEDKLVKYSVSDSSATLKKRVLQAREVQQFRFKNSPIQHNHEMKSSDIKLFCHLTDNAEKDVKTAVSQLSLSARSYFKVIKVARTIADLEGKDSVDSLSIAEALQYRAID
jgi:magnesium chelatase family protein